MSALAPAIPVVDVPLSLFGGTDSELAPSDCPEGVSPDNAEVMFLPGEVFSRWGLAGILNSPTGHPILYQKTYIQPNDDPLTLFLDSTGTLYVEDVGNSPAVKSSIFTITPGLYAQSVSGFGREYIAFSDLLHGQGIPLQYDGTFLDRVTMDGPGAPPTVADSFATETITTAGLLATVAISAISESGNTCAVTTAAPHGLLPGETFIVENCATAGYNGIFTVLTVPSTTTLTYFNPTTGLGAAATGSVGAAICVCTLGVNVNTVPIVVGDEIAIAGNQNALNNNTAGNPAYWQVIAVGLSSNPSLLATQFAFSIATMPQSSAALGISNTGGGTLTAGGQSSVGVHQVVVMWLTRQGYISKPSPAGRFVSVGNSRWTATNLPIGPANVVARVLGFTGAGGDNFFIIPASVTLPNPSALLPAPLVVQSTVVPDNTSTSFTFDVPDNTLFAAVPIDQIGNDLFDQIVLGPVLGFFAYESRLAAWGDYNQIENFLNMGFCGGYVPGGGYSPPPLVPLGWNSSGNSGGVLVNGGPWAGGMVWQITGDGTASQKGLLTQSAYLDSFGDPIISPNTKYQFRLWAQASAPNLPGSIVLSLTSASTGFSSTATIAINTIGTAGSFVPLVAFTLETPGVIPSDLLLSLYVVNLSNLATVTLGENEAIFVVNPFRDNLSRWSYVENPEAFALTTGNLGPQDDPGPLRCFSLQRNNCLLKTAGGVHEFSSNNGEPDTWPVNQITRSVGVMSLRSGDPGQFGSGDAAEDWDVSADAKGLYLFAGGDHWKISQEYQSWWDQINLSSMQTVWVKNDPHQRRIYVGVPIGEAAQVPNLILVMDYRELDTGVQISNASPLHITLSGLMKSSDLTRKWTRWNLAINTGELLRRPANAIQFCLGGNFGNFYQLNPAKLTDDDYGAIGGANSDNLYYFTYGFVNHDQEQQLQLGTGRKLAKRLTMYVTGVGLVYFTPYVDSLNNPLPASSFRELNLDQDSGTAQPYDLMWTTGIRGERIFYKVQVAPLPGETDVQFRLQKLIPGLMPDPIAPRRQMAL